MGGGGLGKRLNGSIDLYTRGGISEVLRDDIIAGTINYRDIVDGKHYRFWIREKWNGRGSTVLRQTASVCAIIILLYERDDIVSGGIKRHFRIESRRASDARDKKKKNRRRCRLGGRGGDAFPGVRDPRERTGSCASGAVPAADSASNAAAVWWRRRRRRRFERPINS